MANLFDGFTWKNVKAEIAQTTFKEWLVIPVRVVVLVPLLIAIKVGEFSLDKLNSLYDLADMNIRIK